MANAKQCDVCGRLFSKCFEKDAKEINHMILGYRETTYDLNQQSLFKKRYDLCPDCCEAIFRLVQRLEGRLKEASKETQKLQGLY